MQLILAFMLPFVSLAAEKEPDWWCRASSGGNSFLEFGVTQAEACNKALKQCDDEDCYITDFGEW